MLVSVNNYGFTFSFEALLATFFIIMVLIFADYSPRTEANQLLDELYIMQKEHDLLKYWLKAENLNINQMADNFKMIFPENCGFIYINQKETAVNDKFCIERNEKITEDAELFWADEKMAIGVTVYY